MKIFGIVFVVLLLSTPAANGASAVPDEASEHGGGASASGKAAGLGPGGGKSSSGINGTGIGD